MSLKHLVLILSSILLLSSGTALLARQESSMEASVAAITEKTQAEAFLATVTRNEDVPMKVGDFRKEDLDGDGRRELVASVDYSGRGFFNTLIVVWQTPDGLQAETLDVWDLESLAETIQDLDGDGRKELLTPELITPYLGTRPNAVWTAVRGLEDHRYVDRSSAFSSYYDEKVLPGLNRRLEHLRVENAAEPELQVKEIERDKVLRALGRDPDAGLQAALEWAAAPEPLSRIYAVSVLKDVQSPAAEETMARLSRDPDREVATYAKSARSSVRSQAEK